MVPRFTLLDLFWMTTLIAVGIGGLCVLSRKIEAMEQRMIVGLFVASVGAIGAGLGAVFQQKFVGAGMLLILTLVLAGIVAGWLAFSLL